MADSEGLKSVCCERAEYPILFTVLVLRVFAVRFVGSVDSCSVCVCWIGFSCIDLISVRLRDTDAAVYSVYCDLIQLLPLSVVTRYITHVANWRLSF